MTQTSGFHIILDAKYRGFVEYVFLKLEIARLSPAEAATWNGLRLMGKFIIGLPSIWAGYRDHREVARAIETAQSKGVRVLVDDEGHRIVVRSVPP